jgi:DNA replication initiation complex subunit (GINS family)
MELIGLKVGPFEEGKEYEIKYWIAEELEKAGIANFSEEGQLDAVKLHKLHWKESVQPTNQIAPLMEDFYPKLRRYLANLKKDAIKKPENMKEYEKAVRLAHDMVNCRLKKIVSLSSAPAQTNQVLNNLTKEERIIYERLYFVISSWRNKILKPKDGGSEQ